MESASVNNHQLTPPKLPADGCGGVCHVYVIIPLKPAHASALAPRPSWSLTALSELSGCTKVQCNADKFMTISRVCPILCHIIIRAMKPLDVTLYPAVRGRPCNAHKSQLFPCRPGPPPKSIDEVSRSEWDNYQRAAICGPRRKRILLLKNKETRPFLALRLSVVISSLAVHHAVFL